MFLNVINGTRVDCLFTNMEKTKPYRGPPPRRDLVLSPSRERDWKGNDLFSPQMMNEEKETPQEVGAMPGLNGEYVDPHMKAHRDYGSDYSKLAMQGGHRDLLRMDGEDEQSTSRKQKGCDNVSEYNRIAIQGGHRDLLKIDENKPSSAKVRYARTGGDWFSHNNNESPKGKVNTPPKAIVKTPPKRDASPVTQAPAQKSQVRNGCLPGCDEVPIRGGKKRFDAPSTKREAPFATFY